MLLSPICLFTYNRLDETSQTVDALKRNYLAWDSELFIFSDGPKDEKGIIRIQEVRDYLKTITGFKRIIIRESQDNNGLANSIINGVSEVVQEYGKVIVLEDDLITSPNFLNFMNEALSFYKEEEHIQSVNGYSLPLSKFNEDFYILTRPFSWGWATWENRWDKNIFNRTRLQKEIDSNPDLLTKFAKSCGQDTPKMLKDSISGKNNSWYIRWAYDHFRNHKFSVYPVNSLVENIGFNSDGTHCNGIGAYNFRMKPSPKREFKFEEFAYPSERITNEFLYYFSIKRKLEVRINALKTSTGRKLLFEEIKQKLNTR
ncbi:glycosyltransferase family 2 protein [Gillisia sp. CAL575]|uniref:glycosyltransferase family 2 protein n=1 Tax=Gillisia sp. CAL575 TaxID=985255 RepID=UPI0003A1A5BF|nr:glycosyltransferase [Gillisia sp. CAL575]